MVTSTVMLEHTFHEFSDAELTRYLTERGEATPGDTRNLALTVLKNRHDLKALKSSALPQVYDYLEEHDDVEFNVHYLSEPAGWFVSLRGDGFYLQGTGPTVHSAATDLVTLLDRVPPETS